MTPQEICAVYGSYAKEYLRKSCTTAFFCSICVVTISSKTVETKEKSGVCMSHFKRYHESKSGMIWCDICCKSICNIGQTDQIKQHYSTTRHVAMVEARTEGKYCATCGSSNPVAGHNPAHKIRRVAELKSIRRLMAGGHNVEQPATPTIVDHTPMTGEQEMLLVVGISTFTGNGVAMTPLCNEHLEKIFRHNYSQFKLKIMNSFDEACKICETGIALMKSKKMPMQGKCIMFEEDQFRNLFAYLANKPSPKTPEMIPLSDVAKYPTELLQRYYVFDHDTMLFTRNEVEQCDTEEEVPRDSHADDENPSSDDEFEDSREPEKEKEDLDPESDSDNDRAM